jgi:predicted nucleic acid-binding protein
MPKIRIFFDSSAFFAGVISAIGAARALLKLAEAGIIEIAISEQVIVETEKAIIKKSPFSIPDFRSLVIKTHPTIYKLTKQEADQTIYMISDPTDAPILAAAMKAKADFLVTHNRKHFIDDPKVTELSSLRIGTPGNALTWIRENLGK